MTGFWWGLLGSSSLLIGAALVLWRTPSRRLTGLIMAFGAGVLISAVAYDLVEDASRAANGWVMSIDWMREKAIRFDSWNALKVFQHLQRAAVRMAVACYPVAEVFSFISPCMRSVRQERSAYGGFLFGHAWPSFPCSQHTCC